MTGSVNETLVCAAIDAHGTRDRNLYSKGDCRSGLDENLWLAMVALQPILKTARAT